MDKISSLLGTEAYSSLLNEKNSIPQHIISTNIKTLENLTALPSEEVKKLVFLAAEDIVKNITTADKIEPCIRISTGCQNLNKILLGGIPLNGICEIYGCSGVGKTQFCLQLALNIQLPEYCGLNKEVVYISTEDAFPSKRLDQLANTYRRKYNVNTKFEDHIFLEHLADPMQLKKCLVKQLPYFLSKRNVGLIIVDSIAGVFRGENENTNYASRSQDFNVICRALNYLQDQYECGILIVNQVTDNPCSGFTQPCLGLSWANYLTHRFCLSRNSATSWRQFEVIFSPDLAPCTSAIIITSEGIVDNKNS